MANIHCTVYIMFSKNFASTFWLPRNTSSSINMSLIICQSALLMTETVTIKNNLKRFLKYYLSLRSSLKGLI